MPGKTVRCISARSDVFGRTWVLAIYQVEECSRPEEIAAECIKAIKRCCSIAEPADTRAQYVREAIRIMKEQFTDDLALEDQCGN